MDDQTKKEKPGWDYKKLINLLKDIKPVIQPEKAEGKGKKRGPGITRKAYNFSKQKKRRKMAKRSRRINRLRGA